MATVYYSMSGEGRGHAARARSIAEDLRLRHRVVLFAADFAYDLLAPVYRKQDVEVVRIPGLRFRYAGNGRVSLGLTGLSALGYRMRLGRWVRDLAERFERDQPDLVVADYEPLLPRAARRAGVPFVSLDHQHHLVVSDFSALPLSLRARAAFTAPFVSALYNWQRATIVSSFFQAPLKRRHQAAIQVGVFLRPELMRARPHVGAYLLVYMRRACSPETLDALASCGHPVRFYGLGKQPAVGRIQFFEFEERRFIDDLLGCQAVVSTAGNQLVGEALLLRKPVLGLPELNNFEQAINAHFLNESGGGLRGELPLDAARLREFLSRTEELRSRISPECAWGNRRAVEVLEGFLPTPARADADRVPEQAGLAGC